MKKQLLTIILVVEVALMSACSVSLPEKRPTTGMWYCEQLDMYLNMETYTGYTINTGIEIPLVFHIDYGNGLFINFCESEQSNNAINSDEINTCYKYSDGILKLEDMETGEIYLFYEIESE